MKKNVIIALIALMLGAGILEVINYVSNKEVKSELEWYKDAYKLNNDLVWKYDHYERCVNIFLEELDSIYNIQDMYPGYLQDAEDEVALQWAKADE